MAKNAYVGVGGKARKVKGIYVGINGKARRVVKGYVGVNGIARQFWPNGKSIGEWKRSTLPATQQWSAVTYGNGRFVAVSTEGGVAYSSNGITWSKSSLPSGCYGWDIAFGNGKFVIPPYGGYPPAYSTDGITWREGTSSKSWNFMSVAYGDGKFVMAGDSTSGYSLDGITWTVNDTLHGGGTITDIAYGDGKFIGVGRASKAIISSNGIDWTTLNDPHDSQGIAYGNGTFIACSSLINLVYISENGGNTWNSLRTPGHITAYQGIAYGDDIFMLVGHSDNDSTLGSNNSIYTSDGVNWNELNLPQTKYWTAAAYGDGRFVALGSYGSGSEADNIAAYALVD